MKSLQQTIIFIGSMLFVIAMCFLLFVCFNNKQKTEEQQIDDKLIIWYIPGWDPGYSSSGYDEEKKLLQQIFPESEIILKDWEPNKQNGKKRDYGDLDFSYSSQKAENWAENWAGELNALTPSERERHVLVGHSLGAKIVIKMMANTDFSLTFYK